jgi:vacuolar-type H+-ATPase subunit I/STV1
MFGDFGHGIMVTLFALYLVIFEKKLASGKSKGEVYIYNHITLIIIFIIIFLLFLLIFSFLDI